MYVLANFMDFIHTNTPDSSYSSMTSYPFSFQKYSFYHAYTIDKEGTR